MKINKILFLTPPALTFYQDRDVEPLPPLGLGYLAAVTAQKLGVETKIVDCLMNGWDRTSLITDNIIRVGLSYDDIKERIACFKPDLVGINCQFSRQYRVYHDMFRLVKEVDPNIITIAGGPHATVCPEDLLNDKNCDYLLLGEAEDSIEDLILALKNGSEPSTIDGIGFSNGPEIVIKPKRRWIKNLDRISFPAFHLMEIDQYSTLLKSHGWRHKSKFMPIITSRGCPAKCTFCSARRVWGDRFRYRSVGNIIDEMKILRFEYGIDEIMFEDDNVTANPKRAKELFRRIIKERLNFIWDTPNGVGAWLLDDELLDLMKASGCVKINFPVESGSQRVLDNIIKKPIKLKQIRKLTQYCRKIGLDYNFFLVIGMPGETIEDIWESFKFAADCGCYKPHISIATPYPGSELFEICKQNNFLPKDFTLDHLFIRSFIIETNDWDSQTLKNIFFKGEAYLLYNNIIADPFEFLKFIRRQVSRPDRLVSNMRRLFSKFSPWELS